MVRLIIASVFCALLFSGSASAATRHHHVRHAITQMHNLHKMHMQHHKVRTVRHRRGATVHRSAERGSSGMPSELAAALAKIEQSCAGFKIISGFRRGAVVAGTHRASLHASGKAADITVSDYSCAYTALKGFPGGVSTDASAVRHIHVSYAPGSREFGARFVHRAGQASTHRTIARRAGHAG